MEINYLRGMYEGKLDSRQYTFKCVKLEYLLELLIEEITGWPK